MDSVSLHQPVCRFIGWALPVRAMELTSYCGCAKASWSCPSPLVYFPYETPACFSGLIINIQRSFWSTKVRGKYISIASIPKLILFQFIYYNHGAKRWSINVELWWWILLFHIRKWTVWQKSDNDGPPVYLFPYFWRGYVNSFDRVFHFLWSPNPKWSWL